MDTLKPQALQRLQAERVMWMATSRPDGRPHLVPIWFVYLNERLYVCIQPTSVKARNLAANPHVTLSLEDGVDPVICEGRAVPLEPPWPVEIPRAFMRKYEWDLSTEETYTAMFEIQPLKWLAWIGDEQA
jgi:hypothetical protein